MEKELYKHEIHMAVALLLCLWFKLDAVIEYGIVNSSSFLIASCILLLAIISSSFPYATDMHREIQRLLCMCVVGVGRYCAGRGTAGKL